LGPLRHQGWCLRETNVIAERGVPGV
jgi:hypothetical protein